MDRLEQRLTIARRTLKTLNDVLAITPVDTILRDAAIQRFEYTFEAAWKAAQRYLQEAEGLEAGSPKSTIRAAMQVGLLDETETRLALEMVDDRNLTSHTYNEALAESLYSRLASYAQLLSKWLDQLEQKMESINKAGDA